MHSTPSQRWWLAPRTHPLSLCSPFQKEELKRLVMMESEGGLGRSGGGIRKEFSKKSRGGVSLINLPQEASWPSRCRGGVARPATPGTL